MSVPGPDGAVWGLALVATAIAVLGAGEALRAVFARWAPILRTPDPIERGVFDLYAGGAAWYLIAEIPLPLFTSAAVDGMLILGGIGLLGLTYRARRRGSAASREVIRSVRSLASGARGIVLLVAAGLFVVEMATASNAATGNTYDSSLLTLYTALLLHHHTIPLSFTPIASQSILYPQGTTVWLGAYQLLFPLEPARTALLVTPLFLALIPLGGFVVGRRLLGTDPAGVAFAVTFGLLGSWSRLMATGSNDFVLAFPLVLLLAGWACEWSRTELPRWPDVLVFGAMLGYSAALDPVGAQWLVPTMLFGGALARPAFGGKAAGWLSRFAAAILTTLWALGPALYVVLRGWGSPGFQSGAAAAPANAPIGVSTPQFIGDLDPFLFRPQDIGLSPIPLLRVELAILLIAGLAVLFLVRAWEPWSGWIERPRRFLLAGLLGGWLLLLLLWGGSTHAPVLRSFALVTNGPEVSIMVFMVYTFIAALPLAAALRWMQGRVSVVSPPPVTATPTLAVHRTSGLWGWVPVLLVAAIVLPGIAVLPTQVPVVLDQRYHAFGNVTPADFDLLQYAAGHLPDGARVLVAWGSAAEFLPGYDLHLTVVEPMVPGFQWRSPDYDLLAGELEDGSLNATGIAALARLNITEIAVTQANSELYPAFSPRPMLDDPARFPMLFHEGDAYLFASPQGPRVSAQMNSSSTSSCPRNPAG